MYATPNPSDNYTYVLFDGADTRNALTVQFVYNFTSNACQLNLAGSIRTAAIQTGNPNPQAALFLFVDNVRLGDMNPTNGNYYPVTCRAAPQPGNVFLDCFVTAFPDVDALDYQNNTAPQYYLALVVGGVVYSTHTPAGVVLIRAT